MRSRGSLPIIYTEDDLRPNWQKNSKDQSIKPHKDKVGAKDLIARKIACRLPTRCCKSSCLNDQLTTNDRDEAMNNIKTEKLLVPRKLVPIVSEKKLGIDSCDSNSLESINFENDLIIANIVRNAEERSKKDVHISRRIREREIKSRDFSKESDQQPSLIMERLENLLEKLSENRTRTNSLLNSNCSSKKIAENGNPSNQNYRPNDQLFNKYGDNKSVESNLFQGQKTKPSILKHLKKEENETKKDGQKPGTTEKIFPNASKVNNLFKILN